MIPRPHFTQVAQNSVFQNPWYVIPLHPLFCSHPVLAPDQHPSRTPKGGYEKKMMGWSSQGGSSVWLWKL